MSRNTVRGSSLTRVTSLEDADILTLWRNSDRAKGITFEDFKESLDISDLSIARIVVLRGASFDNQNPVGTDSPLQIEYGPAVNDSSDPLQMDSAGAITCNVTGQYDFTYTLEYGRSGSGQTSWLFFRLLIDGVQAGNSIFAKLEDSNADVPVQFEGYLNLVAGQVITTQVVRDSQGNDSGGLLSEAPTLGDWAAAPSAAVVAHVELIV